MLIEIIWNMNIDDNFFKADRIYIILYIYMHKNKKTDIKLKSSNNKNGKSTKLLKLTKINMKTED